jgi:hypothetical protein
VDAKLESIVDQFKERLNELVPTGCREKSLAITNIEQAQLWAETARRIAHPATVFRRYSGKVPGWMGWIEWGGVLEAFVAEDGEIVPISRISFEAGEPISYLDADGVRQEHPQGAVDGKPDKV